MSDEKLDNIAAAEAAKSLGNDAFNAKNYDEAIKHYTEAIRHNPENAVFYSNRSVCHASKKNWKASLDDALLCVSKDPAFVKGYLRLATAQIELQMLDDAEATLEKALSLAPDNDQIPKWQKLIRNKKTALAKKQPKQLDEAQRKEYFDLAEQSESYKKDLRALNFRIQSSSRDVKVNQATMAHISSLEDTVPLYRTVGKSFILSNKAGIEKRLEDDHALHIKTLREAMDRKEYIERRVKSVETNMRDLISASS